MSPGNRLWISGLIISLSVAVVIGGSSFVVMTIGTHRFLSAIAGKSLSEAEQVRIFDASMLAPVQVTTVGMLIGAVAGLCVPVFLIAALLQFRRGRRDGA
jgi:hypothetical protein